MSDNFDFADEDVGDAITFVAGDGGSSAYAKQGPQLQRSARLAIVHTAWLVVVHGIPAAMLRLGDKPPDKVALAVAPLAEAALPAQLRLGGMVSVALWSWIGRGARSAS